MPETHDERVARVAEQVRARPASQRLGIRKQGHGHTPHAKQYKEGAHLVDLDGLDRVLSVDRVAKTARVEGEVTLDRLCRATLAEGLLPPRYHARGVWSDLESKLRGAAHAPEAGPIPLWRLLNLWHDLKARLRDRRSPQDRR